jgi:hypothetical protein
MGKKLLTPAQRERRRASQKRWEEEHREERRAYLKCWRDDNRANNALPISNAGVRKIWTTSSGAYASARRRRSKPEAAE